MFRANDLIGPYRLIRKLGSGACGVVWLAERATALAATQVALKMPLDDEADLEAVRQEAGIWAAASGHPNVLPIIEANIYGDQVVIASEYAPDGSLDGWLKRRAAAPPLEAALALACGILAGLEHLHARRIIHRDLKPANVLLQGETPRLADFGISRVLRTTAHSTTAAGSPVYMAPEAFDGRRDEQTDLWSAGVILYQLLAGRLPFPGGDWATLYGAVTRREPEPLPATVPAWLRSVVAKSLAKNRAERYQSAAEMRAALLRQNGDATRTEEAATRTGEDSPPRREPPSGRTTQISRRRGRRGPKPIVVDVPPRSRPRLSRRAALALVVGVIGLTLVAWLFHPAALSPRAQRPALTENLNGVSLEMMLLPGGTFLMGSPETEAGRERAEGPRHAVSVPGFYIGMYEVTQAQWRAVMGENQSYFKGDDLPVENVSWLEAQEFCRRLSRMTGRAYRLPTEAEWEYACRAGGEAHAGEPDAVAWYGRNSGREPLDVEALWQAEGGYLQRLKDNGNQTRPVGQKRPNAWGLYDLRGNVWEWCEDVWHESYDGAPTDGGAWLRGGDASRRVLRGGSWSGTARLCRAASRAGSGPGVRNGDLGLRIVTSARAQ
jgi:eukaryotic-like serine/threonine-protein kinase